MKKDLIYIFLIIIVGGGLYILGQNKGFERGRNFSMFGVETKEEALGNKLHNAIINLRVPGKWRDAGTVLVQTYPHAKQTTLDSLFANILPEEKIDLGQRGRNEPILWVLAMLESNYRLEFHQGQIERLQLLRQSKEYLTNKSFATHVEQFLVEN